MIKLSKKNKLVLGVILAFVLLIVTIFLPKIFRNNKEVDYKKELASAATDFYENFYYGHIAYERDETVVKGFLERFSDVGIKVDLDSLSRFDDGKHENLLRKIVDPKTKETCDLTNTRVIILPKAPFNKTDYDLEVELDCGLTPAQP